MTAVYQSSAAALNIQCDQGASFSLSATCYDDAGLINLTGYSALMQIRNSPTYNGGVTPTVVYSLSTADGQITLGGAAGTIQLAISAANTASLPDGEYSYDLFIIQGSFQAKMFGGLFTVNPRVTVAPQTLPYSFWGYSGSGLEPFSPPYPSGFIEGYQNGNVASADPPTFNGAIILLIAYQGNSYAANGVWLLELLGTLPKNFFTSLQFVDSNGTLQTLYSSNATLDTVTVSGSTIWSWPSTVDYPPLSISPQFIISVVMT